MELVWTIILTDFEYNYEYIKKLPNRRSKIAKINFFNPRQLQVAIVFPNMS